MERNPTKQQLLKPCCEDFGAKQIMLRGKLCMYVCECVYRLKEAAMQCFVLTLFINSVIIVLLFFFFSFSQEKAKSKETVLSVLWCVCEGCFFNAFFVFCFFPSK